MQHSPGVDTSVDAARTRDGAEKLPKPLPVVAAQNGRFEFTARYTAATKGSGRSDSFTQNSMRFLPGNAQHIGARTSQQDSFGFADPDDIEFISHGGFLAVVCDGMGGMEHGDAASR